MSYLLTVLQHGDSGFPSGSFAFSNGIEALCAMDAPLGGRDLKDIIDMFLRHRWATSDRVALALAHRAFGDLTRVCEIDAEVEAATLPEPLRLGSKRNGNALLAAHIRLRTPKAAKLHALIANGEAHGHLSVVQGVLWRAIGIREEDALAVSGYSTATGLITAAVRLGHIGAVEAQKVLTAVLTTIVDVSQPVPIDARIESSMPWVEAAAARHARAHMRLFAS